MNYSIEINGGIGKHIMATSFIKWINETYPDSKINVISSFPEIFEYNPRIHRNLRLGQPYLFEDYIKKTDFRRGEPYSVLEYYRDKDKYHLMDVFPKAYGFDFFNGNPQSEIYLTKGEETDGIFFNQSNQKLFTFQPFGGLLPGMAYNKDKVDSSGRDMPFEFACKISSIFIKKGFKLLQIRSNNERQIPGCIQINLPFRNLLPISKHSLGHIGIDSSMMHGAAVFKKPMLIFWGNTHKDNLGYFYDNVVNASNKKGMHCRPHIQVHDSAGLFPLKDKNDGKEFEYSDKELEKIVECFLKGVK